MSTAIPADWPAQVLRLMDEQKTISTPRIAVVDLLSGASDEIRDYVGEALEFHQVPDQPHNHVVVLCLQDSAGRCYKYFMAAVKRWHTKPMGN